MTRFSALFSLWILVLFCGPAGAQAATFGVAEPDKQAPVEVTSDNLTVKDDENTAIFTGNVVIGRGEMRLKAPKVVVTYLPDQSDIKHAHASGGVIITSGSDAAQGNEADYIPASGTIIMTGNVLLTRDTNAVTGDKIIVDTRAGTAHVTGRVKTVLTPKDKSRTQPAKTQN